MSDLSTNFELWRTRITHLLSNVDAAPRIVAELRREQPSLQGHARIVSRTVIRLALAYLDFRNTAPQAERRTGPGDLVALLRQLIRLIGGGCPVPATLWHSLRDHAEAAGLIGEVRSDYAIHVYANPWRADWLDHSERVDELAPRSLGDDCVADGMLYAMSRDSGVPWTTYRSSAQKAAVDCWFHAPPGSTTLVTLPTGSGKSMCTLLPAWFDSRGGRRSRESTLVIVPTVALALDQEHQATRFFTYARGEQALPTARIGDTPAQAKATIEAAIRDGQMPVIFTSPESLLTSHLYDAVLFAAQRGLISRFIIDEAHLIETWGGGFRTEFQYLASFRRRLLEASQGRLRTLLLSATITEHSRDTLEALFAGPEPMIVIQANRLRPEPAYWFNVAKHEQVRCQRVLEAIRFLPRPLILYVTQPAQADRWARTLREAGYQRLAIFTGNTPNDLRRRILQQWAGNEIDIVIGTSAFGLGVDKDDVRSVIHATIPENVDRFYQEVGRSGRDGYSATSIVCATANAGQDDDIAQAYSLLRKLITFEKALPRWKAMLAGSTSAAGLYWIDRDAVPVGRDDMRAGERNRDWNDHLLLLMQRAELIEVTDAPPPQRTDTGALTSRVPIRILQPAVFNAPEVALGAIEPQRLAEFDQAKQAVQQMVDLIVGESRPRGDGCLANEFAALYADAQLACGGCPACRAQNRSAYCRPLTFSVDFPTRYRSMSVLDDGAAPVDRTLDRLLGAWRTLNLTWQGPRSLAALAQVMPLLPELVHAGFVQVIFPDGLFEQAEMRAQTMEALSAPDAHTQARRHRLLPLSWIVDEDYPLLPLATVVIYPPDDHTANTLYKAMERHRSRLARAQKIAPPGQIHIVHERLYLATAGKAFIEQVDGLTNDWQWLQRSLQRTLEEESFF